MFDGISFSNIQVIFQESFWKGPLFRLWCFIKTSLHNKGHWPLKTAKITTNLPPNFKLLLELNFFFFFFLALNVGILIFLILGDIIVVNEIYIRIYYMSVNFATPPYYGIYGWTIQLGQIWHFKEVKSAWLPAFTYDKFSKKNKIKTLLVRIERWSSW